MNIAIIDVKQGNRDPRKSITVAYRNLIVLANKLCADLFANASDLNFEKEYDAIICGFGSMSCENKRQKDFLFKNKQARLFWLVGEYEQSTFAPLFYACRDQGRKVHILRNFEHKANCSYASDQTFLNINLLLSRTPNEPVKKNQDALYYGRWRQGRERYFREYLHGGVMCSTSSKNIKKFAQSCSPKFIAPMKWNYRREALNGFRYSIYLEDEFTHKHYNCLANRFYEALFCNVAQFFDISCRGTVERSGIAFDEFFYIRNKEELDAKAIASNYNDIMSRQSIWVEQAASERKFVLERIKEIIYDSKG